MELLIIGVFYFLQIYYYTIIAAILLGWIPEITKTGFYAFLRRVTDPYLRIFRGLLVIGMVDLTPILGLLLYQFVMNAFAGIINGF